MSSITVNTLVLGSLTVSVDGTDSTLALSVLGTAPASLTIELGTPGAQGDAATIAVGTTSTLSPGALATVTNVGTSSAAVFNFGIPAGQTGATGATGSQGPAGDAATISVGTTTTGAAGSSASVANVGTSSAAVFNFTIPRGDKGETGNTGSQGDVGPQGPAGVMFADSPLSLDTGTSTLSIDLSGYATQSWVDAQGYLQAGALTGYATESFVTSQGYITSSALSGYATESFVTSQGYITSSALSGYATESFVISQGYQTASDVSTYVTGLGYLTDAPTDGQQYARQSGAWSVVTGGSGTPAADQLTAGVVTTNPTFGPAASGETLYFNGSSLVWGILPLASHAETTQATVRNASGADMLPMQVVYIDGALGNRPTVALAQANSEATSAGTYAMLEAGILNNTDGTVITSGTVMNLDTSSYVDGDKLYLSPSTPGGVTTIKPSAPNHMVYVGTVTRSHPTQGTIQLRIANGFELEELHNVSAQTPSNNDLLAYETATSLWKNKSFATLGLLTSAAAGTTYAPIFSPTFTGTVSLPSGSIIPGYATTAALGSYAPLAGATFTGKVTTVASATGTAGFRLPSGTAPTSPTVGDLWYNGTNLVVRSASANCTIPNSNASISYVAGFKQTFAHSTSAAAINITAAASSNPTTPSTGDVWHDSTTGTNHIVGMTQSGGRSAMTAVRALAHVTVTTGTPAYTAGYNVSSITDNAVGDFTLNFANDMGISNFLVVGSVSGNAGANGSVVVTARATNSARVNTIWNGALADVANFSVAILR